MSLPIDGSCEAEYSDGYIHSETDHNDISPYGPFEFIQEDEDGKQWVEMRDANILNDILEKRPEAEHGDMVRFSMYYQNNRYDVDWHGLPDNARPVRWKRYEQDYNGPLAGVTRLVKVGFGYQYNDNSGKNIQEVQEL